MQSFSVADRQTMKLLDYFAFIRYTVKNSYFSKYFGSPGGTFLLITYYLLLITYHLLLITYYLSLITYYLLVIISFITPITAGNSKYTFPVTAVAVVVVVVAVYL